MALDELLNAARTPSTAAWRRLTRHLDGLDAAALRSALPAVQTALARWPDDLERPCMQRWAIEGRADLLALCRAPGGLLLEVSGGGGGMAESRAQALVCVDRLGEAALALLEDVYDVSGDCGTSVTARPFSHGQVVGPEVDLAPHIEATYAAMASMAAMAAMAVTFRLDAIPEEVRGSLQEHYQRCVEAMNAGQGDHDLVPLELRWAPRELIWPPLGGIGDWSSLERVVIYDGDAVMVDDSRAATAHVTRDYWPHTPPATLVEAADDGTEGPASIAMILASEGIDERLRALLRVLERFGVWAPRSFEAAFERALDELQKLPTPERRGERLCETLADHGRLKGPALATVEGLLCASSFDLDVLRAELRALHQGERLLLRDTEDTDDIEAIEAIEALVPLCAWAVSAHRTVKAARAALAEAIVDHPFVDDLFCEDDELLLSGEVSFSPAKNWWTTSTTERA